MSRTRHYRRPRQRSLRRHQSTRHQARIATVNVWLVILGMLLYFLSMVLD